MELQLPALEARSLNHWTTREVPAVFVLIVCEPHEIFLQSHWYIRGQSFKNISDGDFPGGAVVKNPPANAGDTGLSPDPGRSHMPRSS